MAEERLERLRRQVSVPQFNPSFVPTVFDENTVHIRAGPHTGPVVEISDQDETGTLVEVVEMIDGTHSVSDIVGAFDEAELEEICRFLEYLSERNVITDASHRPRATVEEYYAVNPDFDERNRTRLDEADVLIAAVGRLGRFAARDLLDMGVGTIRFAPLGVDTSEAGGADIEGNERVQLLEEPALESNVEACDCLLYVADRPMSTLLEEINEVAHRSKTPWMVAQIHGFDGFVGPMIFPGQTACQTCFTERTRAHVSGPRGYADFRAEAGEANERLGATLPPFARLVSGYATLDFLNLIAYGQGYTAGRIIHVGALDLAVQVDDVLRLPRCPVCGKDPGDDVSRFVDDLDQVRAHRISEDSDP